MTLKEEHIPHVQGCLENERRLDHMQAYLSGELDYVPTEDYRPDLEKRIVALEATIPVYTEAQELMTAIHADEIVASQDYYHEINGIKTEITNINNQITRILNILTNKT